MKNDQDACPHPLQRKSLYEPVPRFWITDGWLLMKWHISHGSAHGIIQDWHGLQKVCARWVPKQLTEEHKCNCFAVCQGLLNLCCKKDAFFRHAVTGRGCGSTITLQKENTRGWNGSIRHHLSKWSSKLNHRQGKWWWHFYGMHKGQFWNTAKRGAQQ